MSLVLESHEMEHSTLSEKLHVVEPVPVFGKEDISAQNGYREQQQKQKGLIIATSELQHAKREPSDIEGSGDASRNVLVVFLFALHEKVKRDINQRNHHEQYVVYQLFVHLIMRRLLQLSLLQPKLLLKASAAVFLTTNVAFAYDRLYAWGWNNFGQLGLGHNQSAFTPQLVPIRGVLLVACKSSVSAAIDTAGRLYTWGRSKHGLLGDGAPDNVNVPTLVQSLKHLQFKDVACSNYHMAAVTVDGELFTWGTPDHGKLGHSLSASLPSREKYEFNSALGAYRLPQKVELPFKVKSVSLGDQFTLVLSQEGDVFVAGQNKKGVLGVENVQGVDSDKFLKISSLKNIVKIDSGSDFSVALDQEGRLFSWGSNYFGQLGSPSPIVYVKPAEVQALPKIADFACGEQFVGAVSADGKVFAWGYGSDGQLGNPQKQDIPHPHQIDFEVSVKSIACGIGHVALLTRQGGLYMLGRGKEGQLGRGVQIESPNSSRFKPLLVMENVKRVACGGSHTFAMLD